MKRWDIPLAVGVQPPAVWAERETELSLALTALGLGASRPVLVLVGGAANLDAGVAGLLLRLFESLAPRLDRAGAAVIDGATACGVMALMGQARAGTGARFPLVGVVAAGTVDAPSLPVAVPKGTAALDPAHSHFILFPGSRWGDEVPWISAAAVALAAGFPSLTLVAGGGEVTRLDVAQALAVRRRLLVVAGSGGTADLLAGWSRGGEVPGGMALGASDRGLIRALDLEDPDAIGDLVSSVLGP